MFDWLTVYVLAVLFVATLIRSVLGFGEALVAVPLLALRLPVAVAAPLAVLVSVLIATVVVAQDWRHVHVRAAAGLTVAALFGIPLGVAALVLIDGHVVKAVLGLMIAAFAALNLRRRPVLVARSVRHERTLLLGCGFVSGVLGGAYGMNGPPLAVYGAARGWSPQQFRATLQGYFLPASLAGLAGYLVAGVWGAAVTRYFLLSLPAVLPAVLLGRAINRRVRGHGFYRSVYVALIAIGATLVWQSLAAHR